jgi:hypothetical protein
MSIIIPTFDPWIMKEWSSSPARYQLKPPEIICMLRSKSCPPGHYFLSGFHSCMHKQYSFIDHTCPMQSIQLSGWLLTCFLNHKIGLYNQKWNTPENLRKTVSNFQSTKKQTWKPSCLACKRRRITKKRGQRGKYPSTFLYIEETENSVDIRSLGDRTQPEVADNAPTTELELSSS